MKKSIPQYSSGILSFSVVRLMTLWNEKLEFRCDGIKKFRSCNLNSGVFTVICTTLLVVVSFSIIFHEYSINFAHLYVEIEGSKFNSLNV